MFQTVLAYQYPTIFLIITTFFLIIRDRSFSKRLRRGYLSVLFCSALVLTIGFFDNGHIAFNIVLDFLYILIISAWIFLIINKRTDDRTKIVMVVMIVLGLSIGLCLEIFLKVRFIFTNAIIYGAIVYYFYLVMQIYKTDGLTGLLTRHSLRYDLDTFQKKTCCISIIDIDNFKMINDKYGHEKGDEALVTIAHTIKAHMLRGCRLYRFGGDEFAVLSIGIDEENLDRMFSDVNKELEQFGYRISFGSARHEPGEPLKAVITLADERMYENKRLLKSEDIWDDMTGLYNLRGFLDELDTLSFEAKKRNQDVAIIALDIERLGTINMGYGYSEGNMIIQTVASVVKSSLGLNEFAGHIGSDEFLVAIKKDQGDELYLKKVCDQIYTGVKNCPVFDGKEYSIELNMAQIEIVCDELDQVSFDKSIDKVLSIKNDKKENRRKSAFSHDDFEETVIDTEEEALALDIIDNNRLKYALQPIVSAKDGTIVAYEALMRTTTEPSLSPLSVLRYASKNNRDYDIERLTFNNVIKRLSLDTRIPSDVQIFLNSIPGYTLKDEDYFVLRNKYPELIKRLVVEITEQSELGDEALAVISHRMEEDGFILAIDDYGSGNSNTYSLLRYRPGVIKLDRLLINNIDQNTKKQYFVNSIITFAKENGMKILAEGVETEAELKMMIRLQVDYIQGFYTAKPSVDPVTEIDEKIRKMIISENIRGVIEGKRKIYIASTATEASLVQLALEEYTGITVAQDYYKIIGNSDYIADLNIKIKDGITCELVLQDVRLNSIDDMPCIELGEDCHLTLRIEGHCSLNNKGIRVPEGSSIMIKGSGDMDIYTKGHACYGIGGNIDETFGDIVFNHSGTLKVRLDGELGVAIGGGIYRKGKGIASYSGIFDINVAAVDAVGFGSHHGDVPISLKGCLIQENFRVNTGTAIGSLHDNQNITFENYNISIEGSGAKVAGIGSIYPSGGIISCKSGSVHIKFSGQDMLLVGVDAGPLQLNIQHTKLDLKGEGNGVLALGSMDKRAYITLEETNLTAKINSAVPVSYGAEDDNIVVRGGVEPIFIINK